MALEKVESQHVFMDNPRTWKIGEIPGKFEGGSWQVLFQSKKNDIFEISHGRENKLQWFLNIKMFLYRRFKMKLNLKVCALKFLVQTWLQGF